MNAPIHESVTPGKLGLAGRIAKAFQKSELTPLFVLLSLFLGVFAVAVTPREEEPQIIVPMVDVFVQAPGLSPAEVEQHVTSPMEQLLWEIPGVEHVYSTSMNDMSMVIVRFDVGENEEDSLVKIYNKLHGNMDRIPIGVTTPLIKLRSIDDVPVLAVTLHSKRYDHHQLRQVAAEVAHELKKEADISETAIIGGQRREIRVELDPNRLEGYMLSPLQVYQALNRDNNNVSAGHFARGNVNFRVQVGDFFRSADEVSSTVVAVYGGRPVYLSDVAQVRDAASEIKNYVLHRAGAGSPEYEQSGATKMQEDWPFSDEPAVTISVAKRRGTNATALTQRLIDRLTEMEGNLLVSDVEWTITRDYGATAKEKSDELIFHMALATVSVVLLMGIFLGLKEALVVAVAVPVTLALTLFSSYIFGYTLNRVTLFALIFAIGILVDDAIVVVENIHRHFKLGWGTLEEITPYATDEVGNPTILATFAVIFALMPLAFVSGMMGPYMSPIPINASAAMLFSLAVAFVITPWLTRILLSFSAKVRGDKGGESEHHEHTSWGDRLIERSYRAIMLPLVKSSALRMFALVGTIALLIGSVSLLQTRSVKVKMLPHDNKGEFQVMIDMPEGSTLEHTAAAARAMSDVLAVDPQVRNLQMYVGTSAPINFNGLVRHYFLRQRPYEADIQVNLVDKHNRAEKSHPIAKRLRPALTEVAQRFGAKILVAEVPPGPPVWSTLLAEIYGPTLDGRIEMAKKVREVYEKTPGVVDVDWVVSEPEPQFFLHVDKAKAALSGVTTEQVSHTVALALHGRAAGYLHTGTNREPIDVMVNVPVSQRSSVDALAEIRVHASDGRLVAINDLVNQSDAGSNESIHHKDLRPVVYVMGEVSGEDESPVYAILDMGPEIDALVTPDGKPFEQFLSGSPQSEASYSIKWDGEWQITHDVFRDMGIAFAIVMMLVYILVVAYFRSFLVPVIIMAPIPLTLIGILPGHWATGTYFTATSMIGFIALAGIIVRNSILLVDFIEQEQAAGRSLEDAVLRAGAIRFKPIFLTAAALVVGGGVILLDPIFSGLAVSLIFGVVISTGLTLLVIPLMYYVYRNLSVGAEKS